MNFDQLSRIPFFRSLEQQQLFNLVLMLEEWGVPEPFVGVLEAWMAQFSGDDRALAFKVLKEIDYYSSTRLRKVLEDRLDSLRREGIVISGVSRNVYFLVPDTIGDSANVHAYTLTKLDVISDDQFVRVNQLSSLPPGSYLAIVNDTYGSGNQFETEIFPYLKSSGITSDRVLFVGIVIAKEARETFLRLLPNVRMFPEDNAKNAGDIFSANELKRIEELGKKLYPKHPLGYRRTALLVAYEFQCPNNTLPIIWADGNNNAHSGAQRYPWKPLFPYRPKPPKSSVSNATAPRPEPEEDNKRGIIPSRAFDWASDVDVADFFSPHVVAHELESVVGFVQRDDCAQPLLESIRTEPTMTTVLGGFYGMPGVGKTRLVDWIAQNIAPNFSDFQLRRSVRGYDESPALTPSEALQEYLRSLGRASKLESLDTASLRRVYKTALSGKKGIIVVDDVADVNVVNALLPPPGSVLLFTSRDVLSITGGKQILVRPPEAKTARSMFWRIAPAVEQAVVDDICELCENLPLAVCAAAGHIATTLDCDPAVYRDELLGAPDPLPMLGQAGLPRSVAVSFELSYAKLGLDAQRIFRGLAVFSGDFSAEAAEVICGDVGHAMLSFLTKRSLVFVVRPTPLRYRLHSLVRRFASVKSGSDIAELRMRHAEFYLRRLEEVGLKFINGELSLENVQQEADWPEIEAAQKTCTDRSVANKGMYELAYRFAAAAPKLIDLFVPAEQRIKWLEPIRDHSSADARIRARILLRLAEAYESIGNDARAIDTYRLAKLSAIDGHDHEMIIHASASIVRVPMDDQTVYSPGWKQSVDELKRLANEAGNHFESLRARILLWLAAAYVQHIDRTGIEAVDWSKEALRAALEVGDDELAARAQLKLGQSYANLKQIEEAPNWLKLRRLSFAAGWLKRGMGAAARCRNPKLMSQAYGYLALMCAGLKDWPRVIEFAGTSLDINQRHCGNYAAQAGALHTLANAFAEQGDWLASGQKCIESIEMSCSAKKPRRTGKTLALLAENPLLPDDLQRKLSNHGNLLGMRQQGRFDPRTVLDQAKKIFVQERHKMLGARVRPPETTQAKADFGSVGEFFPKRR